MLVRKKMSAKKSAIYLAIILFMIGGAGFMILRNRKLTSSQPVNVNLPAAANNAALAVPGPALGNNSQNVGSLNLNIFSSDKFKNLLASVFIAKEPAQTGKRDPFKPN